MPLARPPRFDEWLECYFAPYDNVDSPWDRFPIGGDEDFPDFSGTDAELVELFTYTMLTSGTELAKFSDHQVGNGLKVIFDDCFSNIARTVVNAAVSIDQRILAIQSLMPLYKDCLTPRAPQIIGNLSEKGNCPPLSYICYMLWDVTALTSKISVVEPSTKKSVLIETLCQVLCLPKANPACIESILHGLGHLAFSHPKYREEVQAAIDYFLNNHPIGRPELRQYALYAKMGRVQ